MSQEETPSEEVVAPDSVRADLVAAFEATVEPEPTATPEASAEAPTSSRARDEQGRFAKSEEPAASAPVADTPFPDPVETETQESPAVDPAAPILAPKSWSTEERALFANLPPEVKRVIANRTEALYKLANKESTEAGRKLKGYEEVERAIAHRVARGAEPTQYVKDVVAGAERLDADPRGGIRGLMQHYGLTLQDLEESQQQREFHPLEQKISALESLIYSREREAQQQVLGNIQTSIERFRDAADETGRPLRPYFDSVSASMTPLIQMVRSENPTWNPEQVLQEAYDRAVYANPQTRSRVLAEQKAADEARSLKDAAKRAAEAKARSSSVVGSPGSGATPVRPDDIRGSLLAQWGE